MNELFIENNLCGKLSLFPSYEYASTCMNSLVIFLKESDVFRIRKPLPLQSETSLTDHSHVLGYLIMRDQTCSLTGYKYVCN